MTDPVTVDDLKARLAEATETMRLLPQVGPKGHRALWPFVIHDPQDAYGWDHAEAKPGPPSSLAITRMDECLEWLRQLSGTKARIVWWRAENVPWKVVCKRIGKKRNWANTVYKQSLKLMMKHFCKRS